MSLWGGVREFTVRMMGSVSIVRESVVLVGMGRRWWGLVGPESVILLFCQHSRTVCGSAVCEFTVMSTQSEVFGSTVCEFAVMST